jgi:hypothetical protein
MKKFKQNIELDARLVLAGMRGGMDGIMQVAFTMIDIFPTTEIVTDRCIWLKRQSDKYIKNVCKRVVELERGKLK